MLLAAGVALAGLLALLVLAVAAIATWVAHKMTLLERVPVYGHPSQLGLTYEDVAFPSRYDRVPLRGWYLPKPASTRCIILLQGEEHHRNSPGIRALELGRDLVQRGFNVLLFDFRGRGESGGGRNSAGDREQWDALGAIDCVNKRGIPVEGVGLLGFSLGAAVAILVAAKHRHIPAIVCDSAFLDHLPYLKRVPFYWVYLPAWFAIPITLAGSLVFGADFANVRPVRVVGEIAPRPIFFIHGSDDQVVPVQETEQLYLASGNRKNQVWIVQGAGHVRSYALQREEYVGKVAEFFWSHLGCP